MNLLRTFAVLASLALASCNSNPTATSMPAKDMAATTASICVVSGEAADSSIGTVDYMGKQVGFCCNKCKKGWEGMDDATKQAKAQQHLK
jgi:hypothetical protein